MTERSSDSNAYRFVLLPQIAQVMRLAQSHRRKRWLTASALALLVLVGLAVTVAGNGGELGATRSAVRGIADHLQLHTLVTRPVGAYLHSQTSGLAISPALAGVIWSVGGIALWGASARMSGLGGYIAWSVATVYVVATATPEPGAQLAAALVALALVLARVHLWAAIVIGALLLVGYGAELVSLLTSIPTG